MTGSRGPSARLDDYVSALGLHLGGAIRASLWLVSNFDDVRRFMDFTSEFTDLPSVPADLPPRQRC